MLFYRVTEDREIIRKDLFSGQEEQDGKNGCENIGSICIDPEQQCCEYLTKVKTDSDGRFVYGISNLQEISDLPDMLVYDTSYLANHKPDPEHRIQDVIMKYFQNNSQIDEGRLNEFSEWLYDFTEPFDRQWESRYSGAKRNESTERELTYMFEQLYKKIEDYWKTVKRMERNKCLWSGMYIAALSKSDISSFKLLPEEKQFERKLSLATKALIERFYMENEVGIWWQRERADFRLKNIDNDSWQCASEYFGSVGEKLEAMIADRYICHGALSDCGFNIVYRLNDIADKIGSDIVSELIALGQEFNNHRYYGILSRADKIRYGKGEVGRITDDVVRACVTDALDKLESKYEIIRSYVDCWDKHIGDYIMNCPL